MERIEDRFSEAQCQLFEENSHHESLHLAIPFKIYTKWHFLSQPYSCKNGTGPTLTQIYRVNKIPDDDKLKMGQALDMHLLVVHQIIAEVDYWLSFELYLTFHFLVIGLDIAPPLLADHILTRYICPLLVYILDCKTIHKLAFDLFEVCIFLAHQVKLNLKNSSTVIRPVEVGDSDEEMK